MSKISLDYNFAAKANIENGISTEDLEKYTAKAISGLSKLKEMMDSQKIGFAQTPYQDITDIKNLAKDAYRKFNDLVIIGIGGSALGTEAVVNALLPYGYNRLSFADRKSFPRCWILDNTDPSVSNSIFEYCEQEDTFVVAISKSGNTAETIANLTLMVDWLQKGNVDIKKHLAVITDPDKGPLREMALEKELKSLSVPANIGGRFSVLSAVGLAPAAILGVDVESMLKGAASIVESDWKQVLTMSAIYMYYMDKGRSINVLMPYSSKLVKFSEWFAQLWGESLGKKYVKDGKDCYFGSTPLRSYGAVDQHSQIQLFKEGPDDKLITFIGVESHSGEAEIKTSVNAGFDYLKGHKMGELLNAELNATEASLLMSKRPSIRLNIPTMDANSLGQLFMLYQYVVAIIGLAGDINPFDQPGVEEGKDFTYALMNRKGYEEKKKEFDAVYVKQQQFIV